VNGSNLRGIPFCDRILPPVACEPVSTSSEKACGDGKKLGISGQDSDLDAYLAFCGNCPVWRIRFGDREEEDVKFS
jgi:hypothetical protein